MAKVRQEIEVVGAEESAKRLDKIAVAYANLERLHLTGRVSAQGYARATENLGLQESLLTRNLQTSAKQMGQARAAAEEMKGGYHDARNAADLLSYTLGIQLPRELKKVIAQSSFIGPALTTAFKFTAVTAGVALIISLADEIGKLTDKIFDWDGSLKQILESQSALNKATIEHTGGITKMREEIERIGLKGLPLMRLQFEQSLRPIAEATKKVADLEAQYAAAQKIADQSLFATATQTTLQRVAQAGAAKKQMTDLQQNIALAKQELEKLQLAADYAGKTLQFEFGEKGTEAAKKVADAIKKLRELTRVGIEGAGIHEPDLGLPRQLTVPLFGGGEIDPEFLRKIQEAGATILGLEQNVQLARARLAGNTVDQILVEESRRVMETESKLRGLHATDAQIENARVLIHQEASLRIAEANKQGFEKMVQQIDQFLDRVFLTARSFSDIWKQLWTQILRHFLSVISRMLAAWITGHQQMAGAGAGGGIAGAAGGGGGGGVGGFIRQLFGFGGGSASSSAGGGFSLSNSFSSSSALPTTRPGGFPDLGPLAGLPMSAGGAVGTGGILATGATVGSTAKLGLGAQLGALLRANGPMLAFGGGLAAVQAIGFGGPGRGAISGGILGGLAGLGLAMLGFPIPGVGILLGALIGALIGKSSQNKKKRQAMDILTQGRAQWQKIISDFEAHRIDYGSAVAGVTQVWQQMVQQWSSPSLGKYGGIAIRNNEPEFRRTLARLDDLQAKRGFFADSPMFKAAGEFSTGGFVSPSLASASGGFGPLGIPLTMPSSRRGGLNPPLHFQSGGAVPAILHQREFVVNAPATASVGRESMEFINRTGRLPNAAGGIELHIHAAPGMNEKQLAEFAIRELERKLRDRGVSLDA